MQSDTPTSYKYYNFNIKQSMSAPEKSFFIVYEGLLNPEYKDMDILEILIKHNALSVFQPMDLIHFCIDFINFRKNISLLMYKIEREKLPGFFFNFTEFDDYCVEFFKKIREPINRLIYEVIFDNSLTQKQMDDLYKRDKISDKLSFNAIEQILISLSKKLFNKQKNFSANIIINSRIHAVVINYPSFGLNYFILKDKLGLFYENGDHLTITDKATKKDWAIYFWRMENEGSIKSTIWKPIEVLFNLENMRNSLYNVKFTNPESRINDMIIKSITLPEFNGKG